MNRIIFALPIFISVALNAQNTPSISPATTTSAAAPTGNTTRSPANPTQPGPFTLRSQNLTNGVTGSAFTNSFAAFTNQFGTNIIAGNVASALLILQSDLQQTLQLIAAFNGSGGIQAAPNTLNNGSSGVPSSGVNNGVNFAQNNGVNFAANDGVNFATSVATPTVAPAATPPSVFAPPSNAPVPPAALATAPTGSNMVGGASAPVSTNMFTNFPAAGGSAQLLVLQNDIQRLLAEISAVTGMSFASVAPNSAGVTAGQLETSSTPDNNTNTGTPRIITRQSRPGTLTPTGR